MVRKYARIFVRGHYLFWEANSFPRVKLKENCELWGTDNVQGHCVYYPSVLKIGEYPCTFPSFSWGIFTHVMLLDQSRASENIWWIIMIIVVIIHIDTICNLKFNIKQVSWLTFRRWQGWCLKSLQVTNCTLCKTPHTSVNVLRLCKAGSVLH